MPRRSLENTATYLYNGMIHPLIPFGIRGVVWYQGENNWNRAYEYRKILPALITDWRKLWQQGEFPFYIVQIANFEGWESKQTDPGDGGWAGVREAQNMTAKSVPNTGVAVTIDIGDAANVHPKNKQDVGARLARLALNRTYGISMEDSGPAYESMAVEKNKIRIKFSHIAKGLVAKNGPLKTFAIAGADKKYVWADAAIENDTVVVSSPAISAPVAVRYAWASNPEGCNLYNSENLPASPFRLAERRAPPSTRDRRRRFVRLVGARDATCFRGPAARSPPAAIAGHRKASRL
jgi:sialate O-acetylesterase